MNALVAKADAASWPAAFTDAREEINNFWTFTVQGTPCSAHRFGTATIGGQSRRLWLFHAPRAVLRRLRDQDGFFVRTLKEIATGAGDHAAVRAAWRFWLVNGTLTLGAPVGGGTRAVTSFPWRFSGTAQTGVDGAMNVSALVRPFSGKEVPGDHEDYDGAEATL